MHLRIPNKGEAGVGGGPPGSLFVRVKLMPSKHYERNGADLLSNVTISVSQALLGGKVPVKNVHGDVELTVKPGTTSGKRSRLRGRGLPNLQSSGKGDHYVTFQVAMPDKLTPAQRELMLEWAALEEGRQGTVDGLDLYTATHTQEEEPAPVDDINNGNNRDGDDNVKNQDDKGIFGSISDYFCGDKDKEGKKKNGHNFDEDQEQQEAQGGK
jgi:DnaJ-class molecular chaperone